jgi:hypothetical protein
MASLIFELMKRQLGESVLTALILEAASRYEAEHADLPEHFDAKYLARDVYKRMGSDFQFADCERSGRPRRGTEQQIRDFTEMFLSGCRPWGENWYGYTSLHHALQENDTLRAMALAIGLGEDRLWERMAEAHGGKLNKISIVTRYKLDAAHLRARVMCAQRWLLRGFDRLWATVWIDEKAEWLVPHRIYRCYAPDDKKSFCRMGEVDQRHTEKIKYEAAVCAWAGPLWFKFVGGTSGREQPFRVRTVIPAGRHPHPTSIAPRPPCLVKDCHLEVCV